MPNPESISSAQQQVVEATMAQILEDQAKIAASPEGYENSVTTATASVGPDGAEMNGNIHYTRGGQIYFKMKGRPQDVWGAGGGAALGLLIGALSADQLAGKTGRFEFSGWLVTGQLQLYLEGQPVFTGHLTLAGGGMPWGWGATGDVEFSLVP